MASLTDHRWGIGKESAFGTLVTVSRFYEWLEVTDEWDVQRKFSQGMVGGSGRRTQLGSRSYLGYGVGKIKTKVEVTSKGLGYLLDLALGTSQVTAITGGTQQVFHDGISAATLPSATIQVVKVRNDGTEYVTTYGGCTAAQVTFEQPKGGIVTCEVEWEAASKSTAVPAAPASYVSGAVPFRSAQGAVSVGGAFTAPTTTALATGLTPFLGQMSEWKLELSQEISAEEIIGGRSQPIAAMPKIKFDGKALWNSSTLPDAILGGTLLGWQQTVTTSETLGAGFTQLQIAVPQMALTGDLPQVKPGDISTIDIKGEVTNDGTNRDLYVVTRTTDVAL